MRGYHDQIFVFRQFIEKFYEKNRDLFLRFVDLDNAYDRVIYTFRNFEKVWKRCCLSPLLFSMDKIGKSTNIRESVDFGE